MEWIADNQTQLMLLVPLLLSVGGIIVKLTPTQVDDAWYQKIKAALGGFGSK